MTVTFCGHSQMISTEQEKLRSWLWSVTEKLILEGASSFTLGGYGDFDYLAKSVLCQQRKFHPHIQLWLVTPYLGRTINSDDYNGVIYPPPENVPLRFAISKRNQWMVPDADVVVAYVLYGFGGASKTFAYARQRKKRIISYSPSG